MRLDDIAHLGGHIDLIVPADWEISLFLNRQIKLDMAMKKIYGSGRNAIIYLSPLNSLLQKKCFFNGGESKTSFHIFKGCDNDCEIDFRYIDVLNFNDTKIKFLKGWQSNLIDNLDFKSKLLEIEDCKMWEKDEKGGEVKIFFNEALK